MFWFKKVCCFTLKIEVCYCFDFLRCYSMLKLQAHYVLGEKYRVCYDNNYIKFCVPFN